MNKITLLLLFILAFLGIQVNAQITSAQVTNNATASLQMQTQIEKTIRLQRSATSRTTNRNLEATYVGAFNTDDGPLWNDNPMVYNGLEAAALVFGGGPSDYAISTNSNTADPATITHTAWATTWGVDDCLEIDEDYSVDLGDPGYNAPGGEYSAVSAYTKDNCFAPGNTNYVWLVDNSTSFITTWQTTIANETINIPTTGVGYNYRVDWGDGTANALISGDVLHTYETPGIYTVKISGDFPRIYFNNSGDREKIRSIEQWGTTEWASMSSAFYGCNNLVGNATDAPDLSGVTDMSYMFSEASVFNQDIGSWNMSNVTTMEGMFRGASAFNNAIGTWDLSNVTNMGSVFYEAIAFNQDISTWNVSSVTNMANMFTNAIAFNQNIGAWNVSNVTVMNDMFQGATLSTLNYDALLNGWRALPTLQAGVNFHAGNSTYCTGENARIALEGSFTWAITDAGLDCTGIQTCTPPIITIEVQDVDGNPMVDCIEQGSPYYAMVTLSGGYGNTSYNVSANNSDAVEVAADDFEVFGPFTVGTNFSVGAMGIQNGDCYVSTSINSPAFCPPPSNDCINSIPLSCGDSVAGTTLSATNSGMGSASCSVGTQKDVFYTLDVLENNEYTVTVVGANYDAVLAIYSGACGSLTEIDCVDNGFTDGVEETITFTAAATEALIIRTYDWSSSAGDFIISVTCPTMSINDNMMLVERRLYPNPLNDGTFYIHAPKLNGEQVVVNITDMAGRQIFNNTLSVTDNKVTVSVKDALTSGMYFVTLKHAGESSTFRVMKK
ncbi:BspA family leucine-rich repeat surface protein [Bizionia argentinensis JUB59]|uniref:BspA family leucine-rich repeat surface protein n=1 Tax=Bizionia argentinensis JUB59 TaxID=1046627 RepID=G2ECX2_9FLAO|nr:BspA family leucine-rich repeat surface protein [Bizionia argentinensis]EGV43707.1 BspA family leucine-rich repeat surface protein [Bizionia argentinensis JUB59]